MTWMQAYLIGLAFIASILCLSAELVEGPKRPHMFAAAIVIIVLWPLIPLFVVLGRKSRRKEFK